VVDQPSVAVGVKVTTPVVALKLDVPATAVPPAVSVSVPEVAFARVAVTFTVAGSTAFADAAGVVAVRVAAGRVVNVQVPPVTAAPLAVAVTEYVVPYASAAPGVNVTTPVVALNAEVPATAEPPVVTASVADDAFARVAVILAVAGSTFVAEAVGVVAVTVGDGVATNSTSTK
jgi:hypothetical protein